MTRIVSGSLMVLTACALGIVPLRARAFQVQPGVVDLNLGAGSSTRQTITVKNTDPTSTAYALTTQKFRPGGDGRPEFLDPADIDGLPSWLRVSEREFSLEPGQEKRVTVDIAIPSSTDVGGSYAAVFVTEKPAGTSPLGIARRIATLFLVSVAGTRGDVRVRDIVQTVAVSRDGSLWDPGFRATGETVVKLKNTGRSHGTAEARVRTEAYGLFGKRVYEEARVVRLLPDEERSLSMEWSGAPPIGFLRSSVVLSDGQTFQSPRRWYALPASSALAGVVLLGLAAAAYRLVRRYRRAAAG